MFEDVIHGRSGIPSLILGLHAILGEDSQGTPDDDMDDIEDIIKAKGWLLISKGDWVAEIANRDIVALMADILRYIPLVVSFATH